MNINNISNSIQRIKKTIKIFRVFDRVLDVDPKISFTFQMQDILNEIRS